MIAASADTKRITAATAQTLRRMAQLTGFDHRTVLIGFAGVVLKTWAGRTKVGTLEKADRRTRLRLVRGLGYTRARERGDVTVNAGYRPAPFGRVWIKVRRANSRNSYILAMGSNFSEPGNSGGVFNKFGRSASATTQKWIANVSDAVQDVQAGINHAIPAGRRSVGLARQSVVQIADSLGIDLLRVQGGGSISAAGIAKARSAMASSGRSYRNGFGSKGGSEVSAYVDLINRLPYGGRIGMDRTLLGVLHGQNKYFERSYAKGAFDSQRRAAAAYPNLFKVATRGLTAVNAGLS